MMYSVFMYYVYNIIMFIFMYYTSAFFEGHGVCYAAQEYCYQEQIWGRMGRVQNGANSPLFLAAW